MNLDISHGKLGLFHRKLIDNDSLDIPWKTFDSSIYDQTVIELGRRAWLLRTMDEYRSMLGFAELQYLATELQAPLDVISCAGRVVRDEIRHVELCGKMLELLGGRQNDTRQPKWVRTSPKLPIKIRAMHHAIGSCCIGETISVTMLAGVRSHASDPVAHTLITQLLKDESFHSRFGWMWLEVMHLEDRDRTWLDRFVPKVFASLEKGIVPANRNKTEILTPFGSMPASERRDRFYAALDQIVEGFESRGLPGRRWWAHRTQH